MKKDLEPNQHHAVQTALILIVIMTAICFFLLLIYIQENRNTREIIYIQSTTTEIDQTAEGAVKNQTNGNKTPKDSNNKTGSTKKEELNSKLESLKDELENESTADRIYSALESSESPLNSEPSSSDEDVSSGVSSTPAVSDVESEPEASEPQSSAPEEEPSFEEVFALQMVLEERFGIEILLSTDETPIEGYSAFSDGEEPFDLLMKLYRGFLKIPTETWDTMLDQEIPVTLLVVPVLPDFLESLTVSCTAQEIQWIACPADIDWSYEICRNFLILCDELAAVNGRLEDVNQLFYACNPADFDYETYRPEYILTNSGMTYFLNIFSQSSIESDRQTLFAQYYNGQIANEYLTNDCPIYYKLAAIEQGIELTLSNNSEIS